MAINRGDFLLFIRRQRIYTKSNNSGLQSVNPVSIAVIDLADNDPDIDTALTWAVSIVAPVIEQFNAIDYAMSVYDLGVHWLIMYGTASIFEQIRTSLSAWALHAGFVQSTSDEGTSVSNQLPSYLQNLSAGDMQMMQTQSGRDYIAIVSRYRDLINFDS
ncbi:hypothetical protein UFOVP136_37 [uncultured Caudovirales phage]|uniref:Uncharacterized protein n=1 Tax=uncultured Caudovirales phage TaxID=2100421 RepID=A0A6J5LC48_9CAUD|nr:hypothetical protein UFOVP136_37 [uncultured Caudovirales phage]